jgi:hypothetical protein
MEAFIKASITCTVGNGERMFFSWDPWLDGQSLANLMPQLVETIPTHLQCRRTVALALINSARMQDLQGALTILVLIQYLHLRQRL